MLKMRYNATVDLDDWKLVQGRFEALQGKSFQEEEEEKGEGMEEDGKEKRTKQL